MNENDRLNTNQQYYGQPTTQPGFNAGYGPPPGRIPQQMGYPQQVIYPPQAGYSQQGAGYPPPPSQQFGPVYIDPEILGDDDDAKGFAFSDESIRKGFIRKVYAILGAQLGLTAGVISLFLFHEPTKVWVQNNPSIWWIALIVLIVTMIPLACCENVRRQSPMNFIFLGLFTLAQSFLLGTVTATYSSTEVLLAVAITATVCISLTIFAFQTRWDFTVMGGILFVALIILILFGIIALIFPGRTLQIVYASVGALLFCVYLLYDTQLMMGGNHKYSISPEEYIFAALNLYLDIINIFIYILMIIGLSRD